MIEDETGVRKLVEAVLGSLGYRVLTAENGQKGLDILRAIPES